MSDLVLAHIVRGRLPWETGAERTECGHDASEFARVATRDEVRARVAEIGKTRAVYEFCITCTETANRHPTWDHDPLAALGRLPGWYARDARADLARRELRAVALLIQEHWDEYLSTLEQLEAVTTLQQRRRVR